jgi:hypothetical protein
MVAGDGSYVRSVRVGSPRRQGKVERDEGGLGVTRAEYPLRPYYVCVIWRPRGKEGGKGGRGGETEEEEKKWTVRP